MLGGSTPRVPREHLVHTTAANEGMTDANRRRRRAPPPPFSPPATDRKRKPDNESSTKTEKKSTAKALTFTAKSTTSKKDKQSSSKKAKTSTASKKKSTSAEKKNGSTASSKKSEKKLKQNSQQAVTTKKSTSTNSKKAAATGKKRKLNENKSEPVNEPPTEAPPEGKPSGLSLYEKQRREFERIIARLERVDKFSWFWDEAPPEFDEQYGDSTETDTQETIQFPKHAPFNWEMIRRRREMGRYELNREKQEEDERFEKLGPYYEWKGKWPKRKYGEQAKPNTTSSIPKMKQRKRNRRVSNPLGVHWDLFAQDAYAMIDAAVERNKEQSNDPDNRQGVHFAASKVKEAIKQTVDKTGRRHDREMKLSDDRFRFSDLMDESTNSEAAMQSWRKLPFPERRYERLQKDRVCAGLSQVDGRIASHELKTSLDDSFIGVSYRYDDTGQSEAWMKSVVDETEVKQNGSKKKKTQSKKSTKEQQTALAMVGDEGVRRAQVMATMNLLLMSVEDRVMTDQNVLTQPELRSANWLASQKAALESSKSAKAFHLPTPSDDPKRFFSTEGEGTEKTESQSTLPIANKIGERNDDVMVTDKGSSSNDEKDTVLQDIAVKDSTTSKHEDLKDTVLDSGATEARPSSLEESSDSQPHEEMKSDPSSTKLFAAIPEKDALKSALDISERDPLSKLSPGLEPELVEQPVWGLDRYSRRNVSICLESEFDSETVSTFVEKWLLPAINACPEELAHDIRYAARLLEGLDFHGGDAEQDVDDDNSEKTSKRLQEYGHTMLGKALKKKMELSAPPYITPAANLLGRAATALGPDFFRVHPKGHGSVLLAEKVKPNTLVTFYRGEIYPFWRWCEKMDAIDITQQRKSLKPALPDFYNMTMERPQTDPRGYGCLIVDASRKAGHGSSLSHSCEPTCEVRVAALNGELCLAMTTLRELEIGEELTFNYNASTDSLQEYSSAICLCGYSNCRGSFLHFATADCYQQVLNRNSPIATRFANLVKGSTKKVMAAEDAKLLESHGFRTAAFGASAVNRRETRVTKHGTDLSDSLDIVPVWLKTYVADVLRYIEYERRALPIALICSKTKEEKEESESDVVKETTDMSNVFAFFIKSQAEHLIERAKEEVESQSDSEIMQRARKIGAETWRTLSSERKQRWRESAMKDAEKRLTEKKERKSTEKNKKAKKDILDGLTESSDISKLISNEFEFQEADSEGMNAMGQRIQQLTGALSRVGRVLDRHREGVFSHKGGLDRVDVEALRDTLHAPIEVIPSIEIVDWIWNQPDGLIVPLMKRLEGANFVRPNLIKGITEIRHRYKDFESIKTLPAESALSDGDSARQVLNEALLELRTLLQEELRSMAKDFRNRNNPKKQSTKESSDRKLNSDHSQESLAKDKSESVSNPSSSENMSAPDTADKINEEIQGSALQTSKETPQDNSQPPENDVATHNANEREDNAVGSKVVSSTQVSVSTKSSEPPVAPLTKGDDLKAMVNKDYAPVLDKSSLLGDNSEASQDATATEIASMAISSPKSKMTENESDLSSQQHQPEHAVSDQSHSREANTTPPDAPLMDVDVNTNYEQKEDSWIARYSERFMLQVSADVLLMYANTSNFFSVRSYSGLESTPIEIYARELGNNVPKSAIDNEISEVKSTSMCSPLSPKDKDDGNTSKKISRKSTEYCLPDDVVAEVKVKYQGDYVLAQLLQWYNGGIGQKAGLPNMAGSVVLPSIEDCWSSKLCEKRRTRVLTRTEYESKIRPQMVEWLQDPYRRGDPWPADVEMAFVRSQSSLSYDYGQKFGSPILDFLISGDESGIHELLDELDEDNKISSADDAALLTSVDRGRPAQAVCRWVQCENPDCLKWRKIPWHVDIDLLPEKFFCKDNKWNKGKDSCDAPEDDWDNDDKIVGSDGKVEGSPIKKDQFTSPSHEWSFQVGAKFDVLRIVNKHKKYSVGIVTHVDFSGKVKRVKFHYSNTRAESDEWVPFGSKRIAPLHTYTAPAVKKRKLGVAEKVAPEKAKSDGGGVGNNSKAAPSPPKKQKNSGSDLDAAPADIKSMPESGVAHEVKSEKSLKPNKPKAKRAPRPKKEVFSDPTDLRSFTKGNRFDVLRTVKGKDKWVVATVVEFEEEGKGARLHFRKSKPEDDEWITFGSPRLAALHTHTLPYQKKSDQAKAEQARRLEAMAAVAEAKRQAAASRLIVQSQEKSQMSSTSDLEKDAMLGLLSSQARAFEIKPSEAPASKSDPETGSAMVTNEGPSQGGNDAGPGSKDETTRAHEALVAQALQADAARRLASSHDSAPSQSTNQVPVHVSLPPSTPQHQPLTSQMEQSVLVNRVIEIQQAAQLQHVNQEIRRTMGEAAVLQSHQAQQAAAERAAREEAATAALASQNISQDTMEGLNCLMLLATSPPQPNRHSSQQSHEHLFRSHNNYSQTLPGQLPSSTNPVGANMMGNANHHQPNLSDYANQASAAQALFRENQQRLLHGIGASSTMGVNSAGTYGTDVATLLSLSSRQQDSDQQRQFFGN